MHANIEINTKSSSDLIMAYEDVCTKIDRLCEIEKSLLVQDVIERSKIYEKFLAATTAYINQKIDIRHELLRRMTN